MLLIDFVMRKFDIMPKEFSGEIVTKRLTNVTKLRLNLLLIITHKTFIM